MITIGSMLANVIVPPKGRFKNGINSHTTAITVEIAKRTADVVRREMLSLFIKSPQNKNYRKRIIAVK